MVLNHVPDPPNTRSVVIGPMMVPINIWDEKKNMSLKEGLIPVYPWKPSPFLALTFINFLFYSTPKGITMKLLK